MPFCMGDTTLIAAVGQKYGDTQMYELTVKIASIDRHTQHPRDNLFFTIKNLNI